MSLGWGLRGSIGGGSLGAMIPGAMIGLVLCVLLNRHSDSGLIAAFAAIGVGFGGQETYGQTVGLSLQPETFWWAILGFVVKGAAWGLLGGAFIGIALDRGRHATAQLLAGFAIMVLGTWIGWQFLNHPKLVYFSNRLDRPREELWAGLWLGGLLLLIWLRSRWRAGRRDHAVSSTAAGDATEPVPLPLAIDHSSQSSPNSSQGWGVRMVPLPHARSFAGQYLLQPQQTRSGLAGRKGFFVMAVHLPCVVPRHVQRSSANLKRF